jgi:hypothetical protein
MDCIAFREWEMDFVEMQKDFTAFGINTCTAYIEEIRTTQI